MRVTTGAASPEPDEWPWLIELDSQGSEVGRHKLLPPADRILLESLAGLPSMHPILFPRVAGPAPWIQGKHLASNRPHMPPGELPFNDEGVADWALNLEPASDWH